MKTRLGDITEISWIIKLTVVNDKIRAKMIAKKVVTNIIVLQKDTMRSNNGKIRAKIKFSL